MTKIFDFFKKLLSLFLQILGVVLIAFLIAFVIGFLLTVIIFWANSAKADYIEQDDILQKDNFIKNECIEKGTKEIGKMSSTTATTTIETCDRYQVKDYVTFSYIGDEVPAEKDEIISLRTSKSQTWSDHTIIYPEDQFVRSSGKWKEIKHAVKTKEEYEQIAKRHNIIWQEFFGYPVYATTTTSTPESGDGRIGSSGYTYGSDWDTIHDADGTDDGVNYDIIINDDLSDSYLALSRRETGGWNSYGIDASFFSFDISFLNSDEIDNAFFSFYTKSIDAVRNDEDDGNDFISLVASDHSSTTALSIYDFDERTETELIDNADRIDISNISDDTRYTIELNNTGIGYIASSSGYVNIALREGHDLMDDAIDDDGMNYVRGYFSEEAGTDKDPYLIIEHSEPITEEDTSELRIDEWFCIATTTGNMVERKCQAPILNILTIFLAVVIYVIIIMYVFREYM